MKKLEFGSMVMWQGRLAVVVDVISPRDDEDVERYTIHVKDRGVPMRSLYAEDLFPVDAPRRWPHLPTTPLVDTDCRPPQEGATR